MTARRRLLAAASATLALAALTACEKPAPIVTVVADGESEWTEAATFCFDEGQTLDSGTCAQRAGDVPQLKVRPGERVGIDVDKELVERGWRLEVTDPQNPQGTQVSPLLNRHYFPFSSPAIPPGQSLLLTVRTVADGGAASGEWLFELVGEI